MSTCPKCGAAVGFLRADCIDIRGPDQSWVGISCLCPKCDTILGVLLDPIVLQNAIARETVTRLQRPPDDGS